MPGLVPGIQVLRLRQAQLSFRIALGKVRSMPRFAAQQWFEMPELRRRRLATAVWIPLRASETVDSEGQYGQPNSHEEIFCVGSIAFPPASRPLAETLGWHDLSLMHSGGPYAFRDKPYKSAEVYQYNDGEDVGIDLIFEQSVSGHPSIWHVNPDLILALGLVQEGDIWVRPEEGYVDVIRQRRDNSGKVIAIEIRSEFLRDYLAARGLALRVAYYRRRMAVLREKPAFNWPSERVEAIQPHDRFEARIFEVDETGGPFGGGVAVFHAWRTDVDPEEDVPVFGPESDLNTDFRSTTYTRAGAKLFRVEGELWREEWIEPSDRSERVRGDKSTEQVFFIVDAAGNRLPSTALNNEDIGRYLWFDPRVASALLSRRGSGIRWYTAYTGSIWCSPSCPIHFGVNRLGLVNVYAYDVAKYPVWQQKVWAGHNVPPDGAVSAELLAAQMRAEPARTKAAEELLQLAMDEIDQLFQEKLATPLFRSHHAAEEILRGINRFRATDSSGLLSLAKDLARLVADRMDVNALRKIVQPPDGEKWGSLKSLEKVLATKIEPDRAAEIVGRLFGIYELRLGDAHLPSSELSDALSKARVDPAAPFVQQGAELIYAAAYSLHMACEALR
jgi:hypothetical protein